GRQRQPHAARKAVKVLPPGLFDQSATQNARPAVQMIHRRRDESQDHVDMLVMIDGQLRLGISQRYRRHGRGGHKDWFVHHNTPEKENGATEAAPSDYAWLACGLSEPWPLMTMAAIGVPVP